MTSVPTTPTARPLMLETIVQSAPRAAFWASDIVAMGACSRHAATYEFLAARGCGEVAQRVGSYEIFSSGDQSSVIINGCAGVFSNRTRERGPMPADAVSGSGSRLPTPSNVIMSSTSITASR